MGEEECIKSGGCPRCTAVPGKAADPQSSPKTLSSPFCPAHNHSLTPCPVGTTHLYEFWWNNTFMNRSVSCFCQLFYPPNQSTPRINHFKNSSQLSMRCPPHPSVQFSHSVVSDSLWPPWTAACQDSLSIANSWRHSSMSIIIKIHLCTIFFP